MRRKYNSYLYSKEHGNTLVDHDLNEADCPIARCNWIQRSDRDLLEKLTTHIRRDHQLSYSTIPPPDVN